VKKSTKLTVLTCFLTLSSWALHVPLDDINILEISRSKKSIKIDVGSLDKIEIGDRGKFYLPSADRISSRERILQEVAVGEAVKVHDTYSYWYLDKVKEPSALIAGEKLSFISVNEVVGGRDFLKILHKKNVYPSGQSKAQEVQGHPERIVVKKDNYSEDRATLSQTKVHRWEDVEENRAQNWSEGDIYYFEQYGQEVGSSLANLEENYRRSKTIRKEIADKIFVNQLNAFEKDEIPDGGYNRRTTEEGRPIDALDSLFETYDKSEQADQVIIPGALHKMDQEGPLWSANFSDEELRYYVLKTGIADEKIRQQNALNNKISHELILRYDWAINNLSAPEDADNQGHGMDLGVGYDLNLARTGELFSSFSAEFFYYQGINYYLTGALNTYSSEYYFKSSLNWYFYNTPSSVRRYMCYLGAGFKFGNARVYAEDLSRSVDYQISALPSYQLGVKYRFSGGDELGDFFRFGAGMNLVLSYETLLLSANETYGQLVSGMVENQNLRIGIGFSFYY